MAAVLRRRGRKNNESDAEASTPVAVVARTRSAARRAAPLALRALAGARGVPMTLEDYLASCRSSPPIPLVLVRGLAGDEPRSVRETNRRFFDEARERLLWRPPAPEVYDAIAGLRTDLAPRRRRVRRPVSASEAEPYLLLEGEVSAVRAERALASPVRNWVVEHVGRVRIGERTLVRLAARGVRWSVLWPVELRAVVGPAERQKRKGIRRRASARRARSSRPSPR